MLAKSFYLFQFSYLYLLVTGCILRGLFFKFYTIDFIIIVIMHHYQQIVEESAIRVKAFQIFKTFRIKDKGYEKCISALILTRFYKRQLLLTIFILTGKIYP